MVVVDKGYRIAYDSRSLFRFVSFDVTHSTSTITVSTSPAHVAMILEIYITDKIMQDQIF